MHELIVFTWRCHHFYSLNIVLFQIRLSLCMSTSIRKTIQQSILSTKHRKYNKPAIYLKICIITIQITCCYVLNLSGLASKSLPTFIFYCAYIVRRWMFLQLTPHNVNNLQKQLKIISNYVPVCIFATKHECTDV